MESSDARDKDFRTLCGYLSNEVKDNVELG